MSDTNNAVYDPPSPTVLQAVEHAQPLLAYLAEHQTEFDPDIAMTLLQAKHAIEKHTWSLAQEAEFWMAFSQLNRLAQPVTIHSLRTAFPRHSRLSPFRWVSKAHGWIYLYRLGIMLLLLLLFGIQIYWLIGTGLVTKISHLDRDEQEILALERAVQNKHREQQASSTGYYIAAFSLSPRSFDDLRSDGVPNEILEKLQQLNETFFSEIDLLGAIEKRIGKPDTERYRRLWLQYASPSGKYWEKQRLESELATNYNTLLTWSLFWKEPLQSLQDKDIFEERNIFEGKNVILNRKLVQAKSSRLKRNIEDDQQRAQSASLKPVEREALLTSIDKRRREQQRLEQQLTAEKWEYERVVIQLPSEFVLEVLQSYILPLLYGLFGAAIYVLRSITKEIEEVTYTSSANIEYMLRLALGALGGLGIGWFLAPEDVASFGTITPLVLSLVAGYNIDLLFTMMDKFIANFSHEPEQKPEAAPTQSTAQ